MTSFGLNPSFCGPTSVLPLFANALRRALPTPDGRYRLFDGVRTPAFGARWGVADVATSQAGLVTARIPDTTDAGLIVDGSVGEWHEPSLQALKAFGPAVLRTLDWQRTNDIPDYPGRPTNNWDLFQALPGRGMAASLQARVAAKLNSHLWWCAPWRSVLTPGEYKLQLVERLESIRGNTRDAVVLEYGNELWNSGFPVHNWLRAQARPGETWHDVAAREIVLLKSAADEVFGTESTFFGGRPYYLFVGGQLTVPSHLRKLLEALQRYGITPDLAGPAVYVTPMKAQKEEWEATGAVPSQDELMSSCMNRLTEIAADNGPLREHAALIEAFGVPWFACYEVGQSLIAGRHPWRQAALAAQRTEWMGELYWQLRRALQTRGVDLANWYSAATIQEPSDTRVDVFGLLEGDLSVPLLPKAKAAMGEQS